jgi:hypothetical protein
MSVLPRQLSQPGRRMLDGPRRSPLSKTIPLNPDMPVDMERLRARIGSVRSVRSG